MTLDLERNMFTEAIDFIFIPSSFSIHTHKYDEDGLIDSELEKVSLYSITYLSEVMRIAIYTYALADVLSKGI